MTEKPTTSEVVKICDIFPLLPRLSCTAIFRVMEKLSRGCFIRSSDVDCLSKIGLRSIRNKYKKEKPLILSPS